MPTPEEIARYHRQIEQLERENPGSNPIILDVGEDADQFHPADDDLYDIPTAEERAELQRILDRSADPANIEGPPPPP